MKGNGGRVGSLDCGSGGNQGRHGQTHKGNERTGHQKGGSSGQASNMSLIKQDSVCGCGNLGITLILYVPFCFIDKGWLALQITYDYNIHGYGGIKYIFSDNCTLLLTWTPQQRASNSKIPPTITPHITIIACLAAGVSGETFIVKCDGGPHLVWKEILFNDDHFQYASTKVMMYDGPLASLQGTLVPALYRVFHEPEDNCAVLLMEYVGKPQGNDWNKVSPGHQYTFLSLYILNELILIIWTSMLADELREKLCAAGVKHGDWAPWNICLHHGEVQVIDFTHLYMIMPVLFMRKSARFQKLCPKIDLTWCIPAKTRSDQSK